MMSFAWSLAALGAVLAAAAAPPATAVAAVAADTLRVLVTDTAGSPLEDATVTIEELGRLRVTGSDGNAVFPDVPGGRYAVVVRRVGYRPLLRRLTLPGSGATRVALAASAVIVDPITVTATRAALDPMASPLSTETIGGDRLRRHEEVSLAHTLDGVAGLHVSSTGLQVGKPIMRGLTGPRVLVLDNGLRLEDYSWSDEDGPSVDPRLAERVEVVRGPASVMYGSDAVGGVINVIPRDLPDALGGTGFVRGEAGLSVGTNSADLGVPLELEGASGSIGWRASAIARRADNFHAPAGNDSTPTGELFNTGYHAVNGDLAIGLHGARSSGALRYVRYAGDFDLLDGPPVPDDNTVGPLRKLADDRVQLSTTSLLGAARLESKTQWERHSLRELVDQSRIGDEEPTFELLLNTVTTDLLLHHALGPRLAGAVGVSGLFQRNESEGEFPLVPGARTLGGALFAFEQATLDRWSVLLGVRADVRHLEVDRNDPLGLAAQEHGLSAVTGDVGVVFRPAAGWAIAGNVGRAFRAPTLFELYTNGPHLGEDRYEVGLPDARAELSLNGDLSVRWEREGFTGQVGGYRNQIDNFLYVQPTDSEVVVTLEEEDVSLPVYRFVQAGRAVLLGIEATVEIEVLPPLTLRGRFDAVRGTNRETGEPLPLMPPLRGDLELELHTRRPGWFDRAYVSAGTEWSARQTRLGPFDTPTDGWALLNFTLGAERAIAGRQTSLQLQVRNATNSRYTDFLSRYKLFAYGQGRNMLARVAVRF